MGRFDLVKDDAFLVWSRGGDSLALAEEPGARRVSVLVLISAAVLYPLWHWIFVAVMPAARDPLGERLGVATVMLAAVAALRAVPALRRRAYLVERVVAFGVSAHYFTIAWRNDLATPYVLGTYVLFASMSVAINRIPVVVAYALFCLGAMTGMGLLLGHAAASQIELGVGAATVLTAMGLGSHRAVIVRRAAFERLSECRQVLKQIIEAIPDPVFVRAADRTLVLSNEAGRQFENATGFDLARVVEQETETLARHRTMEADAEVDTRAGALAVSVKTAVTDAEGQTPLLVTVMRDVTARRALEESLRRKLRELEEARETVRQLRGLLPICMHCSRIRVDDGEWQKLERYVAQNTNASFTHTLCGRCLEEHYPE